jgi:hypothetical protein
MADARATGYCGNCVVLPEVRQEKSVKQEYKTIEMGYRIQFRLKEV